MSMPLRNIVAAIVLLAFGVGYGFLTLGLPDRLIPNVPGPSFFPSLISVALIVLSLALLVQGIRGLQGEPVFPDGVTIPWRSMCLMGLLVALAALLPIVGFLAVSIPFFAALMVLYGVRKPVYLAISAVIIPVVLFYLFSRGFNILLPRGILM